MLNRVRSLIVENVNTSEPNDENIDKLVLITGKLTVPQNLVDRPFGVQAEDCLSLKREVEMFQWVEEKDSDSDNKSCYRKRWRSTLIETKSKDFENPKTMPLKSITIKATKAHVGIFSLSSNMIKEATECLSKTELTLNIESGSQTQ